MNNQTAVSTVPVRDIPVNSLSIDPSNNYRWGSRESMQEDLTNSHELDEDSGDTRNKFEILVDSVRACGVMQPISVQKSGDKFIVRVGFNRALAACKAGLKVIPARVYSEDVPEDVIRREALIENSPDLRRQVPWVVTAKEWAVALENETEKQRGILPSMRMKTPTGRPRAPEDAAAATVAKELGITEARLKARVALVSSLPKPVVEQATIHHWSVDVCKEFLAEPPLSETSLARVLDEMRRSDKTLTRVTARVVSKARERVAAWEADGKYGDDGKVAWRKPTSDRSKAGMAEPAESSAPLVASSLRDVAVNLAGAALVRTGVTYGSAEDRWVALEKTWEWVAICGIGIGVNEVRLREGCDSIDRPSDVADALPRGRNFCIWAFVFAAVRLEFSAKCSIPWHLWYPDSTIISSGSKRSNSRVVRQAVETACRADRTMCELTKLAWSELLDSGCLPRLKSGISR